MTKVGALARVVGVTAALAASAAACARPDYADCAFSCATSGACPGDLTCDGDWCRVAGSTGACLAGDGGVTPGEDASQATDATVARSCDEKLAGTEFVEDPLTGHCYFIGGTGDTYEIASQACAASSGHAVQIADQDEADLLAAELLAQEGSWWIGLEHSELETEWVWVTGEPLGEWADWFGEPSGDGDCVELFINDAIVECFDGCWNDLGCDEHVKFAICELEP